MTQALNKKFKKMLDKLPYLILKDIIELASNDELLNLRFLNKTCYEVVNQVLYERLTLSKFFSQGCRNYQLNFYSRYGTKVQHLEFTHFFYSLPLALKQCSNIVSLDIKEYDTFQYRDLSLVSSDEAPFLRNLSIGFDGDLPFELPPFPMLANLTQFQLQLKRCSQTHINYFLENLSTDKLIKISISCEQYLELEDFTRFEVFDNLKTIQLNAWELKFQHFNPTFIGFKSLTTFELSATIATDLSQLSLFYDYLTKLPNLKTLLFNYCNHNQCSNLQLKSPPNTQLETIMLSGCTKLNFEGYDGFKYIKQLNLNCFKGFSSLLTKLSYFTSLKVIKLYWYFEDKDIAFENAMTTPNELKVQRIDFYHSHMTVDHLFAFLSLFPELKYLYFYRGKLSSGIFDASFRFLNDLPLFQFKIHKGSYPDSNPLFHEIRNHSNILFFHI
ncbi:hypothetical protein K502DRAFT_324898 [Neoconidiobolus thromboides FSU 785]|nr:hypothetical protein K502DRAFT_324898 [Neoconidiobolus thromboides FSU 785]